MQTNVILPSRKAIPGIDTDITQNGIIYGDPTYFAFELVLERPLHTECANHVSRLRAPLVSPFGYLLSEEHCTTRSTVFKGAENSRHHLKR